MLQNTRITLDPSELAALELQDVQPDSVAAVETELDLAALDMKNQILDSFDDLIAQKQYRSGLLYELTKLRMMLTDGGQLTLRNRYAGPRDSEYEQRADILLTKAGFDHLRFSERDGRQHIEARRRPYIVEKVKGDQTVREVVAPAESMRCHEFAKEIYYYKDYNYDIDVARQFDLNSDMFALYDNNDQILAIARSAARVPGYSCPFMYATEESGQHIDVPPEYKRFCEIMVLFQNGQAGALAFKRITEYMLAFFYEVARYDSFWTTYDMTDVYTGTYYKTRFMLSDYHKILIYRDFGGKWSLIVTNKIKELYENRFNIFSK